MLDASSILQQNSGTFEVSSASPGTVSLPGGTTAGSAVIICAVARDADLGFPNGDDSFVRPSNPFGGGSPKVDPYVYVKKNVGAGETSWTLGPTAGTALIAWHVFELPGIGLDPNVEYWVRSQGQATDATPGPTRNTGLTSAASSSYDTLSFALFAGALDSTTVPVWSGYDSTYSEVAQVGAANGAGTKSVSLAVAVQSSMELAQFDCDASVSPDAIRNAAIVTFFADGARRAADLHFITGFGFGTATTMTATSETLGISPVFDTVVGTPAIVTTTPRSGVYCLELSSSAAAENVTIERVNAAAVGNLAAFTPSIAFPWVDRFHIYLAGLPAADTELYSVETASGIGQFWYRSASQKIGVKVGTGTEVLSDTTVSANQWIGVDVRYDARNTAHLCDWAVDYDAGLSDIVPGVPQTQAVGATTAVANIDRVRYGWNSSRTATIRYADIGGSKVWGAYPIGDLRTTVVKVDPAGTPAVSGTAANFEVFTSNGTGSAFNAANARNAVDDVPPTLGATADGIMQVAVAASDYVEFPMDAFTAAPDYALRAARCYLAGWASTGSVATIGAKIWDGETELVIASAGDHGFSNGSTPVWLTRMLRPAAAFYLLTQTRLNSLAFRVGYSGDAAPDVGFHTMFVEVAYQPATIVGVIDGENGAFMVYARLDPISGAPASYEVTTPSGTRGATFNWEVNGVAPAESPHYVDPNTTWELSLGASSVSEVNTIGLGPDPA